MVIVDESLGNLSNLTHLGIEESGELRVYLSNELTQDEIEHMSGVGIVDYDCRVLRIKLNGNTLSSINSVISAVTKDVIGWQLLKNAVIPLWGWILGGLTVGYLIFRRKQCLGCR